MRWKVFSGVFVRLVRPANFSQVLLEYRIASAPLSSLSSSLAFLDYRQTHFQNGHSIACFIYDFGSELWHCPSRACSRLALCGTLIVIGWTEKELQDSTTPGRMGLEVCSNAKLWVGERQVRRNGAVDCHFHKFISHWISQSRERFKLCFCPLCLTIFGHSLTLPFLKKLRFRF